MKLCAKSHVVDYTLCGVAFDLEEDPPVFATPGQTITCTKCRAVINHARQFKSYKQPKDQKS